ncbi:MAG: Hsp70 family protein [Paracoccaceae bacterium]
MTDTHDRPIGIDLGTTNSLVALWTAEGPRIIENALGEALTPSVVGLADDATVLVGQAARERLVTHPRRTAGDFKRLMGTEQRVTLGDRTWRAEELSSMVLRALVGDAEAALGHRPTRAVVSVPAYFSDPQRRAVFAAGRLAGLEIEALVNEPTAAALAYGLADDAEERQFLVFDLGGGTFDVSLLDKYEGLMEVRASAGDNHLGGNDFRDQVERLLLGGDDPGTLEPPDRAAARLAATRVCHALSRTHEAPYTVRLGGRERSGTITREAFAEACEPLFARLRAPLRRAVADAGVEPDDIDQVLLVGGATRMPGVRELVARLFGRLPLGHIDPDRTVALGAAVQAALRARSAGVRDVVMTDVCPHTLGTRVLRGDSGQERLAMQPVIERNAVVPVSRTMRFHTVRDRQRRIAFDVLQGEHMDPERNVKLGALEVGVPAAPAGKEAVDVRFTYDTNGALEVEIASVSTGKTARGVFAAPEAMDEREIERRFRELAAIKIAPRERAENAALVARAERLYAEARGETREAIEALLARFLAAIEDQRLREPDRVRREFAETLDSFENPLFRA